MDESGASKHISPEIEQKAAQRARDRARTASWDINVAVFLFSVLAIMIILLFQGIGTAIVGPIAAFGLAMVWLVSWRRARQLYPGFYDEEISRLEQESKSAGTAISKTVEQTIEEKVQKALRERWR